MNIEKTLREYKTKKSKIENIKIRIEGYEMALDNPEDFKSVILTPGIEPGMPRGSRNLHSSPVEYAIWDKEEAIKLIKEWMEEDNSRLYPLELEIKQIESAIRSLTYKEQKLVEWKYFEGMFWRDIEMNYNDLFRNDNNITESGLKKLNKQALKQIEDILKDSYKKVI